MSNQLRRVVDPVSAEWAVRAAPGAAPLAMFASRAQAVARAEDEIRGATSDGSIEVYGLDGAVEAVKKAIAGRFIGEFTGEEKVVNNSLKAINVLVGLIALAFPGVTAALVSSAVHDSLGAGWVGVFLATFALSGGVAAATFLIGSNTAETPFGKIAVVVGCVVVTSLIAAGLGYVSLPLDDAFASYLGPWYLAWPAGLFTAAMNVYGGLGAALGLLIGVWVGWVAVRRFARR